MPQIRRKLWLFGVALAVLASSADGQEARTSALVDLVTADGVYLSVGTVQGFSVGDTIAVYASAEAAETLGRVLILSASRRRSIARPLSTGLTPTQGDQLFLAVPSGRLDPTPTVPADSLSENREAVTAPRREMEPTRGGGAARWSGRVSLDADGRESRVSWGGRLAGSETRQFATSTARLTLRGSDLPGGLTFQASLRSAYRYTDGPTITPTTSVRAYSLSLTKRFTRVPLEIRAGRFSNTYEIYSAYWDGISLRLGRKTGPGIGVVAGLEPKRSNESPIGDRRKITAFADYNVRRADFRYSTDISAHLVRPTDGSMDRTFVGWSQQLTAGWFSIDQRAQLDRVESTGEWSLSRLRLRATARLESGLRLHVGGGRSRPLFGRGVGNTFGRTRDEIQIGMSVRRRGTSFSADVGQTRWDDGDRGTAVSTSLTHPVGRVRLLSTVRYWFRGDQNTLSLSPGFGIRQGRFNVKARYQYYRTDALAETVSHLAELGTSMAVSGRTRISLDVYRQFGSTYQSTRVRTGISTSF